MSGTVLVVDGDAKSRRALCDLLSREDVATAVASTGAEALAAIEGGPADVVVTELRLADMDGLELLGAVLQRWPDMPVILLSADATVPRAVEALKAGAADFLLKPVSREQIAFVIKKALASVALRAETAASRQLATSPILGDSPAMREALRVLERAAPGSATVLVRGESGTGKELIARAVHELSLRAAGPFVKIDCASLPEALLESELFGYEKGAFTGAVTRKPGRVELADGGTLFLDEIGELSGALQAKLLRLLQDREFERLGGTKTVAVDVRVVAATHRDLETMVERNQFRQDLFYRLNVVPLWLPPLRARRADVEALARHFCTTFAAANKKPDLALTDEAVQVLRAHRWPGNVRQLQNFMERLVVLSEGPSIDAKEVQAELSRQVRFVTQSSAPRTARSAEEPTPEPSVVGPLEAEVHAAEKKALERALQHAGGNRSLAARLLGVSRSTLYAKLEEHGLL